MDAKELRIGNLINEAYPGGIWKPCFVTLQKLIEITRHPENFEPIALTAELLEKVGFIKRKYKTEYPDLIYHANDFMHAYRVNISEKPMRTPEEWVYEFAVQGACGDWITLDTKYKYLHQLQNLYFALTHNELNITL